MLIEMDIVTDPNLPLVASKLYTIETSWWVQKEVEDLEKAGIIQQSLSPCVSS